MGFGSGICGKGQLRDSDQIRTHPPPESRLGKVRTLCGQRGGSTCGPGRDKSTVPRPDPGDWTEGTDRFAPTMPTSAGLGSTASDHPTVPLTWLS